MFKLKIKKIIAIALALTLLCGCYSNGDNEITETPTPPPDDMPVDIAQIRPLKGGTLRLSMRHPLTLNPILNEDKTVDTILRLLFEPLVVLDESQKPVPNLAESVNFASDGLSVIITLKDELYWSDGERITAQDIVFTLNTITNAPEQSVYKNCVKNMQNYSIIDSQTVKITYSEAFGEAYYMLMFPVIPTHYYQRETTPSSPRNMFPIGSGTFKFVKYDTMRQVYLERNDLYSGNEPYIDDITVNITSDYQTDLYSFEQGVIDAVTADFDVWSEYGAGKEVGICEYDSPVFEFIGFNFSRERMDNLQVRKAIAHAVDLDEIAVNVYLSHADVTKTLISSANWLYEQNVAEYPYDLEAAKKLLAQSGVPFVVYDRVSIIVNSENEERVKIAEMLSEALNEIGLYNTVEPLEFDAYSTRLVLGEYDIMVGGFSLDIVPDFEFMLRSSQGETGGNLFNYGNEHMDNLIAIAKMSGTETSFKKAMSDIQKEACDDLPIISIAYRKKSLLTDKRIYGDKKPVINNPFSNISDWFIDYMVFE